MVGHFFLPRPLPPRQLESGINGDHQSWMLIESTNMLDEVSFPLLMTAWAHHHQGSAVFPWNPYFTFYTYCAHTTLETLLLPFA
ncbi:hypothetical protein IQE94_08535 [Synechocystis sp. PCC 7339]|uniref:hypothetical protein n=1 Tax=Synechocystis sp. PCC 7339 TaxID=2782213 RepID=UPI001CBF4B7F|nr:hypothetical protein [Synechocystis sp. PCC 7339]UAJ74267.1 hypothetical protein IQE94_08535 [Synechocystis sp. PCC 7339]